MAEGRSIGKIFVELDLDPSRYTKGQQQLLKDATTVSLKIEDNFKNLGIKSSAVFDLMRQKIINSYEMIANSSKATANDIVRAEEAKNAKIKALNEEQYGKSISFIDKIKANWIAASAAIVAAWMLVNKAVAYMDEAGKALQIESAFKIMADAAKVNSEHLIASMKKATKETIDDSDLMQKAVKLMTLGYDPSQIERFSKVVITASQIAGTTAAQAYDELADAIGNRMPKALVRMGAVTREQMKIVNEAIEAGADSTVLFGLAMANLEMKQKMLQGTQNEATIQLQRFHAEMKEFKETIGKGLIIIVDAAYRAFQYLAAGVLGLVSAYARYRELVYKVMGDEQKALENRDIANAAWLAREELVKKAGQAIFLESGIEERATKQEIANAKAKVNAQMAGLKGIIDAKKALKDLDKDVLSAWEAEIKRNEDLWAIYQGQNEVLYLSLDTLRKMDIEIAMLYASLDKTRSSTENWEDALSDIPKGYAIINGEMKKIDDWASMTYRKELLSLENLETQIAKEKELRDAKVSLGWMRPAEAGLAGLESEKELIAERLALEEKRLERLQDMKAPLADIYSQEDRITMLKREQVVLDASRLRYVSETASASKGITAGLQRYVTETGTLYTQLEQMSYTTAKNMESAFSNFFESIFDRAQSWRDRMSRLFKDLANSYIKALSDMLAKQLVSGLFGGTTQNEKGPGWTNYIGLIGGLLGGIGKWFGGGTTSTGINYSSGPSIAGQYGFSMGGTEGRYQHGGQFWVDKPRQIMVGEGNEPEYVTVTPRSKMGAGSVSAQNQSISVGPIEINMEKKPGLNPALLKRDIDAAIVEALKRHV